MWRYAPLQAANKHGRRRTTTPSILTIDESFHCSDSWGFVTITERSVLRSVLFIWLWNIWRLFKKSRIYFTVLCETKKWTEEFVILSSVCLLSVFTSSRPSSRAASFTPVTCRHGGFNPSTRSVRGLWMWDCERGLLLLQLPLGGSPAADCVCTLQLPGVSERSCANVNQIVVEKHGTHSDKLPGTNNNWRGKRKKTTWTVPREILA